MKFSPIRIYIYYFNPEQQTSVNCTFNGKYVCGYNQPVETYLQWTRIKGRGPNSASPRAARDGTIHGMRVEVNK